MIILTHRAEQFLKVLHALDRGELLMGRGRPALGAINPPGPPSASWVPYPRHGRLRSWEADSGAGPRRKKTNVISRALSGHRLTCRRPSRRRISRQQDRSTSTCPSPSSPPSATGQAQLRLPSDSSAPPPADRGESPRPVLGTGYRCWHHSSCHPCLRGSSPRGPDATVNRAASRIERHLWRASVRSSRHQL